MSHIMTEAAHMFRSLSAEETAVVEAVANNERKPKPVPIVPVPADAPPMNWWHREHGEPSKAWAYHDAQGRLVGYVCRWDFTNSEGERDKDIRPVCYCDLGGGKCAVVVIHKLRQFYKLGFTFSSHIQTRSILTAFFRHPGPRLFYQLL